MIEILRKSLENHEAQFPKFNSFFGHKSIYPRYYIQIFGFVFTISFICFVIDCSFCVVL